ncbi:hypothetical protein ACKC9G_12830 [Pokkaliibacter sp. CJK22405]|uniref:hypothetical protein n=1 Tax=Pokkaliibacter sp. CJK22405 TaxID=3384615 RepID=UPI0039854B56
MAEKHRDYRTSAQAWAALEQELKLWKSAGDTPAFWWRDDDAVADTSQLQALKAISEKENTPVFLAVIPADLEASLAPALANWPLAGVLQHGFDHHSHAAEGERKLELDPHRAPETIIESLNEGFTRLAAVFKESLYPVLVPPWNRYRPDLPVLLAQTPLKVLSGLDAREPAAVAMLNVHVDLLHLDKEESAELGEVRVLTSLIRHLAARRLGQSEASEPTGIMTHHLVMSPAHLSFLERLLHCLNCARVHWITDPVPAAR